jgi:hypothetical protein
MEMSSAHSPNTRLSFGPPQAIGQSPCGGPGRIDRRASKRLNSDSTPVLHSFNNDWMVARQAIAGSAAAQEHLFGCHRPRLYRIALGIFRNKEDAEDALQNGLYKAYSRLQSFQGRSAFSTWLTRIVINSVLMARRRNRYRREACLDEFKSRIFRARGKLASELQSLPENGYRARERRTIIWAE